MNKTNWKDIAELLGIAAIVASLIFVGLELRQSQQNAWNESRFRRAEWLFITRSAINENAEVWVKGNAGEGLNRSEAAIYGNLIRDAHTNGIWTSRTERMLGMPGDYPVHAFAWFLFKNPGAQKEWESQGADREEMGNMIPMSENIGFSEMVRADLEKFRGQSN